MSVPPIPRDAIRDFLAELSGTSAFADDDNLADIGVVQSMRLLELIDFVADRFGVEVTPDDIYQGRFRTVTEIVHFVATRAAPSPRRC
jgi:acyl carrier protein